MKYINIENYLINNQDLLIRFKENDDCYLYFLPDSLNRPSIADMFNTDKRKMMRIISHKSSYETIKGKKILNPFDTTPKISEGPVKNSFYLNKY